MKKYILFIIIILIIGLYIYKTRDVVDLKSYNYTGTKVEKAFEELQFDVKCPNYEGYKISSVEIYSIDGKHVMIEVSNYLEKVNKGEGENKYFYYTAINHGNKGSVKEYLDEYDTGEPLSWKPIKIKAKTGYITEEENESCLIVWKDGKVIYRLTGDENISKKELIQIAESFK